MENGRDKQIRFNPTGRHLLFLSLSIFIELKKKCSGSSRRRRLAHYMMLYFMTVSSFFCPILGTLFRSVRHRMHTNGRLSGVWKTQHQQNKKNNGSAHNPNPRIYLVWKLGWTMAEWEHFRDTKKWAEENFVCRQTERNCALLMAKHGVSLWRRLRTENTQRHTKAKKGKHFVPFTFYTNELLFKLRVKLFHLIRFSNENMLFHFV